MAEEKPPDVEEEQPADPRPGFVVDAVRKAVLAGMGALFLTEDGARRLSREWKLPKDLIGYVVGQAAGAKNEMLRVLAEELNRFFQSETLRREFLKALTSTVIEVRAEVRLRDAGEGELRSKVSGEVRPRGRPAPEPAASDPLSDP